MKGSREIKVGLLAIVCAGILYFGFNFLKGVNIFSPTDCYYGTFERSNGLTEQAPVYILGHKVGSVESVKYDFTRTPAFTVGVSIDDGIALPKGTKMALIADGLLGGAAIELILPDTKTTEVHKPGETLASVIVPGMMDNLQTGLLANIDSLIVQTNTLIASLNNELEEGSLHATLQNIEQISADLQVSGADIRQLTHNRLPGIMKKVDATMTTLQNVMVDLKNVVSDVNDANIQNTISELNRTIANVNSILESEDGTLGLLLNDTELHDNLNNALKSLDNAVSNVDSVVMAIKARPFIKKKLPRQD